MKLYNIILLLAFFMLWGACNNSEESSEVNSKEVNTNFTLVTSDESNIRFTNTLKDDPESERNVLSYQHYYNGAGVAVGDINNDGLTDLFFVSNEGDNKLYLNEGDFKFQDISEGSGINPPNKRWSTGTVMADVNADGWLDIYVCQAGYDLYPRNERGNLLLINNGDNTFTESAAEYGIDDRNESVCAAFFDYDKDGDLDLYVLNESEYVRVAFEKVFQALQNPQNLANASGNLFRNDGGTFTKVTEKAGVLAYGFGLGLNVTDINQDGWPDIYVSNDYSVPDFMFINNGDGTFTDEIKERTRQISFFGMGNDINDYNNDGLPDIAVVDMASTDHVRGKTLMESMDVEGFWYFINDLGYQYQYMFNTLQLNNGNGTFSNIAALAGMLSTDWSWAVLLADINNDGWKDCYVTNGFRRYARDNDFRNYMDSLRKVYGGEVPLHKKEEAYAKMPQVKTENLLYINNRDLTFKEAGEKWGVNDSSYSYGAAYADLDNDGDLDLVVNNIDHESFLYKNNTRESGGGNYLQFTFRGNEGNHLGYNTKVYLYHDSILQYQEFHPTRGYASSVDHILHFGVGQAESIDSVIIEWQNGNVQVLTDLKANQRLTVDINDAIDKKLPLQQQSFVFEEIKSNEIGVNFRHSENQFNDFAKEILLPHKQSTLGPKISTGDVNSDGLEDFYIGGAQGQSGALYLQMPDGTFNTEKSKPWTLDISSEDMGSHMFDADGDGDLDLYVTSGGGGEMEGGPAYLNDRLYINLRTEGNDGFAKVRGFEEMISSSNVVTSSDFDGDGDLDLFIGGAAEPGRYPFPDRSYLLRNEGNFFTDITNENAPGLVKPGMVKDAEWHDINNDGFNDLIIVGEWMPVMIFENDGNGHFKDVSSEYGTDNYKGWWYSLEVADVNNDQKMDLILGNVGLNIKFSASEKKPFHVFGGDFDENGIPDIVLSKKYNDKLVPTRGRECSSQQMPFIKEKFPTYNQFAHAELVDIYTEEKLSEALHREVNTFRSAVLINKGDHFDEVPLPNLAQVSPINQIITEDFNGDGNLDLLVAGNMYNAEVETPRYDAGNGLLLVGDGFGNFEPLPLYKSGFFTPKNVKDLALVKRSDGSNMIIVLNNDDQPQFFTYKVTENLQ